MDQASLLSVINDFQRNEALPSKALHPFGDCTRTTTAISALQDLIHAGDQLTNSLTLYSLTNLTNPKLCSLLREQCQITHSLHISAQNRNFLLDSLRSPDTVYGEDIPLDTAALPDWCVARFEGWGSSVGLEAFRDDGSKPGRIILVFGGKVVVLDVEFVHSAEGTGRFELDHVKVSYAVNHETHEASQQLDGFLSQTFGNFVNEVTKPPEELNPVKAAKIGQTILGHLQYLVMLDKLASRSTETGGGIHWFLETDQLARKLLQFSKEEATEVARALNLSQAPLDTFLRRSHGLPLPCLMSPGLSFLLHVTPAAYLDLLTKCRDASSSFPTSQNDMELDIPTSIIRASCRTIKGCQYATLSVSPTSGSTMSVGMLGGSRPTFPLAPTSTSTALLHEHSFPHILSPTPIRIQPTDELAILSEKKTENCWILDFTNGGSTPGVIMSQSRMRAIECAVNPLNEMNGLSPMLVGVPLHSGSTVPSWVDLLLNPNGMPSSGYSTVYSSPSDAHAPLRIHLTTPSEPGFVLEKVPVHNVQEVMAIIELVREQCWLNSTLENETWSTDPSVFVDEDGDEDVTEDDLVAALTGNMKPHHIPVNLTIPRPPPPPLADHNTFDANVPMDDLTSLGPGPSPIHRPQLIMTSPEKPPLSGMLQIVVSYDDTKAKGVRVEMNRMLMMGDDDEVSVEVLEEVVRRGGILGIVGRIFGKSKT